MGRKKISKKLRKIVVKEKLSLPKKGVRALAGLIKEKYNLVISKSAVAKILKEEGLKLKRGRKPAYLKYKQREVADCGLILLSCIDSHIGLFDYLTEQLKLYLPHLSKDLVKKFIILASLGSFRQENITRNIEKTGFLRLVDLNSFPARKFDYFKQRIAKYKPLINLKPLKEDTVYVSTAKFIFKDRSFGLTDAKLSTFWDSLCKIGDFFLLKQGLIKHLDTMLKNKLLVISYTKSFGYLSQLVIDFILGLESGLEKIQFLDSAGKLVGELNCNLKKLPVAIGYSPQTLNKGIERVGRSELERRIAWDELGGLYFSKFLCRFIQVNSDKGVVLNNVRIKEKPKVVPSWGLLSSSGRTSIDKVIKNYLYRFPQTNNGFKQDLKVIEKSLFSDTKQPNLVNIFPDQLKFRTIADFAWISQILSAAFKEIVGGWEPRRKKGNLSKGRSYLKISLEGVPAKIEQNFNQSLFYHQDKRVFLT
ncbi:MAG: hypothetical protein K9L61_00655 [Candidatus Omnitrophica bacterium]|nr:hypothetical protein [Candidatus Omnitrophota bacterium]